MCSYSWNMKKLLVLCLLTIFDLSFYAQPFFSHTDAACRTIMSFDRLVRSSLGLCDSFTPGDYHRDA